MDSAACKAPGHRCLNMVREPGQYAGTHPWLAGDNAAVALKMVLKLGRYKMVNGDVASFL